MLRYGNRRSVSLSGERIGSPDKAQYRPDELERLIGKTPERKKSGASALQEKVNPGTGAPGRIKGQ